MSGQTKCDNIMCDRLMKELLEEVKKLRAENEYLREQVKKLKLVVHLYEGTTGGPLTELW
jgi:cell division protein FtsB